MHVHVHAGDNKASGTLPRNAAWQDGCNEERSRTQRIHEKDGSLRSIDLNPEHTGELAMTIADTDVLIDYLAGKGEADTVERLLRLPRY